MKYFASVIKQSVCSDKNYAIIIGRLQHPYLIYSFDMEHHKTSIIEFNVVIFRKSTLLFLYRYETRFSDNILNLHIVLVTFAVITFGISAKQKHQKHSSFFLEK